MVMNRTRPVEISIHAVSPELMGDGVGGATSAAAAASSVQPRAARADRAAQRPAMEIRERSMPPRGMLRHATVAGWAKSMRLGWRYPPRNRPYGQVLSATAIDVPDRTALPGERPRVECFSAPQLSWPPPRARRAARRRCA